MSDTKKINKKDFILYILSKLEPNKSDKIRLNKLAFFIEFSYLLKFDSVLSNTEYAAIDMGPVIDGYDSLLSEMQKEKLVKIDGYIVRPLKSPSANIPTEVTSFIDGVIDKYSKLTNSELIGLSHLTDSYKITTNNEKIMGQKINKKLASLETFFLDDKDDNQFTEDKLPKINRSKLIQYEYAR